MTASAPPPHLAALQPVIGRWRTSGTILDEQGLPVGGIAGADTYTFSPGNHWIVHEVDVMMDGHRSQVLELIGGHDETSGGWQMHAFDGQTSPGRMTLTLPEPGLLLLQGDGVRSWLRPEAGPDHMTTLWEREIDGSWVVWMDMRFDRQ